MPKYPKLKKEGETVIITILATIGFPKDDTVCVCESCEVEFSGICGFKSCRQNNCPYRTKASKHQWEDHKIEVEIYINQDGVTSSLDYRLKGFYDNPISKFARTAGDEAHSPFSDNLTKLGKMKYMYFFEWATLMEFFDYFLFQYNGHAYLISRDIARYRKMKQSTMHNGPCWTDDMDFFPSTKTKSAYKK